MNVAGLSANETRKKILFVDDEANILEALQNLLRKQRRVWDMSFALGGEAALEELARNPFDIVISDMRMPRMDGAALLREVRDRHPAVVRIVLSGHADRDAIARALPVVHQFLSKPCDPDTLRDAVGRACETRDAVGDDALRRVVGAIDTLPSVPHIHAELLRAVARPQASVAEIAAIVETDPAMSAKVLQLVNSAYFGLVQRTTSVPQAVSCLGLELVRQLALGQQAFRADAGVAIEGFSLEGYQEAALARGRAARAGARESGRAEEAFTVALLRDVGTLVLASAMPERLGEIARCAREADRGTAQLERELLGTSRAQIGAYLLGIWGLPSSVFEAVARQDEGAPA